MNILKLIFVEKLQILLINGAIHDIIFSERRMRNVIGV